MSYKNLSVSISLQESGFSVIRTLRSKTCRRSSLGHKDLESEVSDYLDISLCFVSIVACRGRDCMAGLANGELKWPVTSICSRLRWIFFMHVLRLD